MSNDLAIAQKNTEEFLRRASLDLLNLQKPTRSF